jgi:hypothetical protein
MPKARIKSKLPIEIVAQRTHVITHLYATPDPRLSVGLSVSSTNVGAGCSCHSTGVDYHRSLRVPFYPCLAQASRTLVESNLFAALARNAD